MDNRKQPIRGLWRRNGKFLARITVESDVGHKAVKWVPLDVASSAEAKRELDRLVGERSENRLRHIGRGPKVCDYMEKTYLPRLETSGKKPDTLVTEKGHLKRWRESIGHLFLDKIRPYHLTGHLQKLKTEGRASRTCNLSLVCLRNMLKSARVDGFIKGSPSEGIPWQRTEKKARRLYTREEVDLFCKAASSASKNGTEFADYIRLLALCGGREQETIKLRWDDVDFERKLLTVGADGDTKNREARRVDFNAELEIHLKAMRDRRAPDSQWMFPSAQRGERDARAKTFRESLLLTRAAGGWVCRHCKEVTFSKTTPLACPQCRGARLEAKEPALPAHLQRFGFHDCRHFFCSYSVMSGIDYMSIARWVGHKDGGILIGKVYGHLTNEHAQRQAQRLNFSPTIAEPAFANANRF
ncbi:MAG: hypothetical protein EXS36_14865 [Pedosphaera sp.]|nr:hypothetical protein [Pedosphaera sp.]